MDLGSPKSAGRMLDSWHMKSSKFPGSLQNFPLNRFGHFSNRFTRGLIGKIGLSVLLISVSAAGLAQQLPQGTQGQGVDCSDPMNMSNPQCQASAQSPSGTGQTLNPLTVQPSVQPQSNGTYTDNESFLRGLNNAENRQPLPPEPLTEFQKFVASTTGVVLPIYGVDLFRNVPSTFSPLQMTPVPSDFVIGPGDEVRIRVWGQVSFQANIMVDRSGDIYLPHIGPVHVAGLQFGELDSHLREAIARVYRNFDLTVDMGQIRSIQVYVAGQARRPGMYTVSSLSTLVDALFASGGPSVHGSLRNVLLRRGSTVVADFDLYDLIVRGDKSKDVKLLPGDVIYIPPAGPQVAVTGSVRVQAIYELRGKETLGDLFKDTGGITAVASSARVSIERIEDHQDREAMEVANDKAGLATPLADGDLIHINPIVPRYEKTVTLRGNIANPGRFAWHAGMRVSELIPDKDSLITRNYWWRRTQQGLPAPEFEPTVGWSNMAQPLYPTRIPAPGSERHQKWAAAVLATATTAAA
jgi:protein involved in polysaccharide export with SLBB domain